MTAPKRIEQAAMTVLENPREWLELQQWHGETINDLENILPACTIGI